MTEVFEQTDPGRLDRIEERVEPAVVPVPLAEAIPTTRPGQPHFVVVTTRGVVAADGAPAGAELLTRFWHPRDRRWSENTFETIEHAIRLFVDESGWVLLQRQELDQPHAHELVFEARREDFTGPSTEEILEEVGLTPEQVEEKLKHVNRGERAG